MGARTNPGAMDDVLTRPRVEVLLRRLCVLARLKQYEKLSVDQFGELTVVSPHPGAWVQRRWYGDSRAVTLQHVDATLRELDAVVRTEIDRCERGADIAECLHGWASSIEEALGGLASLKLTYAEDPSSTSKIGQLEAFVRTLVDAARRVRASD